MEFWEASSTYQAIVRRGRVEGARHFLLLVGSDKFGPPDPATLAALEAIDDMSRLEQLGIQLMSATSWQELLPTPPRRRRGKRRSNDA